MYPNAAIGENLMITAMPRIAIAVNDFEKTVDTFRNKLGMPVQDISESSIKNLGAKLAMCLPGDGSNIELMSPADPGAPLSVSLQRFLDRRGEGLFALMLEAPDPNAEAERLIDRGLNVLPLMAGAGGRDVHPNSTHGVLVRVYPVDSFTGERPAKADPQALSGITRVIIAVNDLEHASKVYGQMFAFDTTAKRIDPERGVASVICTPPSGGQIELVAVEDTTRPFAKSIEGFLASHQEGMYALVLTAHDLPELAGRLTSQGLVVRTAAGSADCLEIERADTFGALILIEVRD
jgi:catechol 2,3-dioxygenase-like lactoylglutathione lyase family enzyme